MKRLPLLIVLFAAVACHKADVPPLAPPPPAISVTSEVVAARPMPQSLAVTGSLTSNQRADVAANATGKVMKTFVERGSVVEKDAPLVQLDPRNAVLSAAEAGANSESAHAQEELAKQQCARNQELLQKGAISKDEWERFSSQCRTTAGSAEAARARVEIARKSINDATIRAPFAGMIVERFVSAGEYVQPQTKVATLVELDPLRLQITISEADLRFVHEGQEVKFAVQSFPGVEFPGTIRYVGPAVRENTRDLVVEAVVANADHRLRPGMFATADLALPEAPVPAVPKAALQVDGANTHLFAVVDGHVEERIVQTGVESNGYVAVVDGLKPGEQVVTKLGPEVVDGVPVK